MTPHHLFPLAHADMGMLRITPDPGDAQIFINGQRRATAPARKGKALPSSSRSDAYAVRLVRASQ